MKNSPLLSIVSRDFLFTRMISTFVRRFQTVTMETGVTIRQITLDDSARIAELSQQLGYPSSADEIRKRLKALNDDKDHCTFSAIVEETVVGWIHAYYAVRIESDPFVEIGGLVIDEIYRGQHIGEKLVTVVTNWARMKGVGALRVRSNTQRHPAHQFYKHIGFKEIKEQKIFSLDL